MAIDGWTELCLGEILCSKNDKSKQVKSSEYQPIGLYPIVDQSSDFICGYCDDSKKVINNELPYTIFGDHTRHTKFVNFPFVVGADGTQIIKPIQSVDDRFFFYLVLDAANKIGNYGYDRHFKHLREFRCIFPIDKKEQTQIAEVLSTIDRAIAQTEAIIAKQQRIKMGLMQDLLTKGIDENGNIRTEATHKFKDSAIGRIPVEWDIKEFENIAPPSYPICYGIVQTGEYDDLGVPVAGIYTLNSNFEEWYKSSKKIEKNYSRSRIKSGDILISVKGSIGIVGVVPEGKKGNISRDIARIKVIESIEPHFVRFLMISPSFQKYIGNVVVGTTRSEISIKILRKMCVIIPQVLEQQTITAVLQKSEDILVVENKKLEKLCNKKNGLMQDLLTGKVRVTNFLKEKAAAN